MTVLVPYQPVDLGVTATQGDDLIFTFTLQGSGAITSATVTCSIRPKGETAEVLADKALVITDAGSASTPAIVTLTILDTESDSFKAPPITQPDRAVVHVGDILVVETDASETHWGPFSFNVRRRQT